MINVQWAQNALDRLAAMWMQSDSQMRQEITSASHRVEKRLRTDPFSFGESRPGGRRIAFELPLGVLLRISSDGKTVFVLNAWQVRKRRGP